MQEIADWLKTLGMSEYAQRFAENGIDVSALRHLNDQDLKDIGVLLGHRGCDPVALKAASRCLRRIKDDAGPSRPSSRGGLRSG